MGVDVAFIARSLEHSEKEIHTARLRAGLPEWLRFLGDQREVDFDRQLGRCGSSSRLFSMLFCHFWSICSFYW